MIEVLKMKLKVKTVNLDAGSKTIAIINREDARELGVHPLERIILSKGSKSVSAAVDISSDFVREGEIAVYAAIRNILKLKSGEKIDAEPRKELASKDYIRKKIDGYELNRKEIKSIICDVLQRNLNDLELASFITALHIHGLTMNETISFSKSMIETSNKISFPGKVCDKHSIGGVSGDKTSILLVPIIASCGLTIPKTSSRAITSPAGTADRMEILAPVNLCVAEIKRVVKRCNGCLVWGGAVNLAPADDLFIQIENPLSLDPLMLPSVMSKKKAMNSKYVVIDIPCGPEAKMKSKEEAENLANNFITLGKELGMKVDCSITRGNQPFGYAVGPALEAREALEIIMNIRRSPDVIDKATTLAGTLLRMVGRGNKQTAEKILKSGIAEKKLREIIGAQGGDARIKPEDIPYADYKEGVKARFSGVVSGISDDGMAAVARAAGAPKDSLAGITFSKKIGDIVRKGETLFTIHAEKNQKLKSALKLACNAFEVAGCKKRILIEEI